ncbi:kelch-like protein 28 [Arctopsyche grandis]|uniref:kelch-like protein 28 n=1 Tax=Arctopsyche grandis TaxID=121162 RepID=UPI00406D8BFC
MSDYDDELRVEHAVSHMQSMRAFYTQKMFCDIVIVFGEKSYSVHRSILLTHSQYFRDRLDVNTSEFVMQNNMGIREETVEQTIQYLYEGSLELMVHQVANIIKLADLWELNKLKMFCFAYLGRVLNSEKNVLNVSKQIDGYLLKNFPKIMMHESFLRLSVEDVKALLQSDDLQTLTEEDALKGLRLWVKKDWINRKKYLYTLMKFIRLPLCSISFLLEEVGSLCSSNDLYELLLDGLKWHQIPDKRSSLSLLNSTPRNKQTVLIIGGHEYDQSDLIEAYNPSSKKWYHFCRIGEKITEFSSVILGNTLMMFGGLVQDEITNRVRCLNLVTKELTELPTMNVKRRLSTAALVDGQIFLIGGFNRENGSLNSVEQFNPIAQTWKFVSPMNFKRHVHASVVYGNNIYVIGGRNDELRLNSVEVYCTKSDEWRIVSSINSKRSRLAAVSVEDSIYAIGGIDGSSITDSMERYNPKNDTWTPITNLPEKKCEHCAVTYKNKIICFGGWGSPSILEYNVDTNQWKKLGDMKNNRIYFNTLFTHLQY